MHARAGQTTKRAQSRPLRIPRGLISITVIAAVLGVSVAFGRSTWDVYRLERTAAELVQAKEQLRDQNDLLREEIRLLHTPAYIEKLAREQLGLVKPGEVAILLVPPSPPPPSVAAPPRTEQVSWATRLWSALVQFFSH